MDTSSLSLIYTLVLVYAAVPSVRAADSATMAKLLAALSPSPSGWSSKTYYCKWNGISCDSSSSVTGIDLSSLSLSGTLPDLSALSQLKSVSLQRNSLSGAVPSFANLQHLVEIFIDFNNFTSVPAGVFEGLTSLETLSMGNNFNLQPWTIPTELKQSATLQTLEISSANINGTVPEWLGSSFPSLQHLRLSYNKFTGSLPSSFQGSSIKALWMNNQQLSGTIDVLSTMTSLEQAWLHVNDFTGPIPDLSKCVNLFDLQLRDNSLTGIVPPDLTSLPSLQNASLKDNKLQGPVPANPRSITLTYEDNRFCRNVSGPCDPQVTALLAVEGAFGYPLKLADSWEGNDACSGWDYVTCDGSNVSRVVMSKQNLTGRISPAFGNLTTLTVLMLNDNGLTGTIPESLTTLPRLQVLDVSNNNLSGKIPTFSASVKLNTSGNPFIGKDVPDSSTPSTSVSSTSPSRSSRGSGLSIGVIIGIILAALFLLGIALFIGYKYIYSRKKYRRDPSVEDNFGTSTKNGNRPSYSVSGTVKKNDFAISDSGSSLISMELIRRVTHNFSEEQIIGRGGFGTVYKGVFPDDGVTVAIKRMESVALSDKGVNEFQAEIAVLSKVRHRHLVALLGYCINGNERLLVYEYMPQGTLSQHLFEWQRNQTPPLTWRQRVMIALDVARGVEYLHSLAQQSFIHRDLKPSNILLGNDMRAKVSDFGLVKNAPEGKYSVETRLAGTFGYLAPEYAATGRVTTKVDVFAFGVILMELVTGRKALDDTLSDDRAHLVTWFRRVLISKDSNIAKTADPTLTDDDVESIRKVSELAGHCTAREAFQRPDMGHAVNVLSPLVEQWKPFCQADEEEDSCYDTANVSLRQVVQRWQQTEGSTFSSDDFSYSHSIPSKPSQFQTPNSMNCR